MLFSLPYSLARFLAKLLLVRHRSDAQLRAEVLALGHQLRVLERQAGRPRWQPPDRLLLLTSLCRLLPRPAWSGLLPRPETLLLWHRELVRRKGGRLPPETSAPSIQPDLELHDLILPLAREDSRWGYPRIQGELRKLGHSCSHVTVGKVLRRHRIPPALTIVKNRG